MPALISYLLLFHLSVTIFGAIEIPGAYVSDGTFIGMTTKKVTSSSPMYASPSGSGSTCSNNAPCTIETAFGKLKSGSVLYLKQGTYNLKNGLNIAASGTASSYIVISSAPNEQATLTSSRTDSINLITVSGSYIIIENLIMTKVTAKNVKGIVFWGNGQNHVIIRNNKMTYLKTSITNSGSYGANGILLMGESTNTIKNVMIYNNQVRYCTLGYSEGISIAGNCENIYVISNYVKDNTNIGIDFYGNAGYCSNPSLDQPRKSVAINNDIERISSPNADCAGLYVDGGRDIYLSKNFIYSSQYGIEIGSEERNDNYPVTNIIVQNNTLQDNTVCGLRIGGYDQVDTGYVKNSQIKYNEIKGSNYAIIISKADNIKIEYNKFVGINTYFVNMEFTSTYTKNIAINYNKFNGSGRFKLYGGSSISLNDFVKKYPSNTIN